VEQGWSVREMEARVKERRAGGAAAQRGRVLNADAKRVEDALRKRLGTDVRVTARRRGRGFLTVSYYSNDDLARLLELILGQPFEG
jgi:ParB-like chromosome segregation protein Spo0J